MNRLRAIAVVLMVVASVLGAAGCGGSDDDGGEVFEPAPTLGEREGSTTSPPSTTVSSDPDEPAADPAAERWIGTEWGSVAGESSGTPVVDGEPISLTSVLGMCMDTNCDFALDLLTEAEVDGLPPAGDYVLWASRLTDRTDDGLPNWEVTDARTVALAEGDTTYLCGPTGDPQDQVLGIAPMSPGDVPSIEPVTVWDVDAEGMITSPDPSGFRCDVGGF